MFQPWKYSSPFNSSDKFGCFLFVLGNADHMLKLSWKLLKSIQLQFQKFGTRSQHWHSVRGLQVNPMTESFESQWANSSGCSLNFIICCLRFAPWILSQSLRSLLSMAVPCVYGNTFSSFPTGIKQTVTKQTNKQKVSLCPGNFSSYHPFLCNSQIVGKKQHTSTISSSPIHSSTLVTF